MNLKKKVIILVVGCMIILAGALVFDSILGKTYLNEIKYDKVIEKINNKESFVLLISQTTCSHCISYKPKLEKIAKKYKIEVFYIDVDLLSDSEEDEFSHYISYSSTPDTLFIKNGEETSIATRITGNASTEKIINKFKSNGFIEE